MASANFHSFRSAISAEDDIYIHIYIYIYMYIVPFVCIHKDGFTFEIIPKINY